MLENFSVTTKVFVATLFVDWCEIALVHSVDTLEFWERNPQFDDARSANGKHEERGVKKYADKEFRYNRGKKQERSSPDSAKKVNRATYRTRGDDRKNEIPGDVKHGRGKVLPRSRGRTSKLLKPQQYSVPKSHWNGPPSTRITPMSYVQPDKGERDEFPETLTSYFISRQLKNIADKFSNANVTSEIIGRTVEYNDIVLLKITQSKESRKKYFRADESKYIDEVAEKKIVFIVHGLSIMGMHMLPCLSSQKEFSILMSYYLEHLDKFDIFIIPLANPDGYAYKGPIWNKNMSPQTACPGVTLDRNFDVAWNVSRTMSSCSQLYPGPHPFSEAETKAIRDVFHHYSHKIIAYFNVHGGSYNYNTFKGDAVLYPKGYTEVQSDDDKYLDLRGEVDEALKNANFQVLTVTVDTLHNWYGKISGSSVDYASTIYGVPYALEFVMQLYDNYDPRDENNISYYALTEIWRRLIDVIFSNIWKNTHNIDVK